MKYREYLQSDSWKALRKEARERSGNRCEFCGGSPDNVHHVQYPKGGYQNDTLENLIVVCESCHMKSHGIRGKKMTKALTVDFSGDSFCATEHDGKVFARFEDVRRILGFLSAHWETCRRELIQGEDWTLLSNPFTGKIEPFISESGVLIVGMRFGMNDQARNLRRKLADMAISGQQTAPVITNMGDAIIFIGQSIKALEEKVDAGLVEVNNRIDNEVEKLKVIVDDYQRASDYIRENNLDVSEKEFGMFVARAVKSRGCLKRADGWYSPAGERISYLHPAPDTLYKEINKWRKTVLAWAYSLMQAKAA